MRASSLEVEIETRFRILDYLVLAYGENPPSSSKERQYFRLPDLQSLKPDQYRAFDIVAKHLHGKLSGESLPPLRMKIVGVAGTGKSAVLEKIQQLCDLNHIGDTFATGAFTANAARRINGDTLHAHASMTMCIHDLPKGDRLRHLQDFWANKTMIAIDEFSMVFKTFIALFSRNLALAKGFQLRDWYDTNDMFGGMDVLLVGDLHQIPPVARGRVESLFTPENVMDDSLLQVVGRRIYQSFSTTVVLQEQVSLSFPST